MKSELSRVSRNRIKLAGERIAGGSANSDDWAVFEHFRMSHNPVLNTFRSTLIRHIESAKNTTFAQRLKRKNTIIDKLRSGRSKDLSRMQDLAGCRLIFKSIDELKRYRKRLHSARFKHERKNGDKYDYISQPKQTGYRGIHDVFSYFVPSERGEALNGLLVEIQYRTSVQHAWATAVEMNDLLHKSRVKFETGVDPKKERFFSLASELLARHFEGERGPHPDIKPNELKEEIRALEDELRIIAAFGKLHKERVDLPNSKNIVLHFDDEKLQAKGFRRQSDAMSHLKSLEQQYPSHDIVAVRGSSSNQIKSAFRNYFRDSREFVNIFSQAL